MCILWVFRILFRSGKAARAAVPTVSATARLAKQTAGAITTENAVGVLSAARWMGSEIVVLLEFARSTLYRCMKALSAVAGFLVAMLLAVNRHRVSLMLQAQQVVRQALPWLVKRKLCGSETGSRGHEGHMAVLSETDVHGEDLIGEGKESPPALLREAVLQQQLDG